MRFVYLATKPGEFPFETGADLYCEVQPGKWVHASQVPGEVLRKHMENGSFKAFEIKPGKPMPILNLADVQQRLIAARLGLTYAGRKTDSLREIDEALKYTENAIGQVEFDELMMVLDRLEKVVDKKLQEERKIQEIVEEVKPVTTEEVLSDLSRAFRQREKGLDVATLSRIAEASQLIASSKNFFADPKLFAKLKRKLKIALRG